LCFFSQPSLVHHATIAWKHSVLLPTYRGGTYVHKTHMLMILDGSQQIDDIEMKLPAGTATAAYGLPGLATSSA
jgi:hypothetical protein